MIPPLVSVVVPTYNRKILLKETIFSILKQTFKNFELIIVSDGSSDGTNEMVSKIKDSRVRLITQEKSGQPAKPRNTGIILAKGKYVALCDDDDLWELNKLKIQIERMESNNVIDMCYTNGKIFKDGVIYEELLNRRKVFRNHFRELLYGNFIPNSSVLIKKTILDKVGLINVSDIFRGIEDYEFWLRLAYHGNLLYIDQPLIKYRVHSSNITYSRSLETARAIKVVKHVSGIINISRILLIKTIFIQYIKYCIYKLIGR
jgi:teichuronic acid biosynthesis glycosyltransferase TuaG